MEEIKETEKKVSKTTKKPRKKKTSVNTVKNVSEESTEPIIENESRNDNTPKRKRKAKSSSKKKVDTEKNLKAKPKKPSQKETTKPKKKKDIVEKVDQENINVDSESFVEETRDIVVHESTNVTTDASTMEITNEEHTDVSMESSLDDTVEHESANVTTDASTMGKTNEEHTDVGMENPLETKPIPVFTSFKSNLLKINDWIKTHVKIPLNKNTSGKTSITVESSESMIEASSVEETNPEDVVTEKKEMLMVPEPFKNPTVASWIDKIKLRYRQTIVWLHEHVWAKKLLQVLGLFVLVFCMMIATMIASYFGYLLYKYERIPDNYELDVKRNRTWYLKANEDYHLITMNVGYGISTPDFTYYFDEGKMSNGSKTRGEYNFGISKERVDENITDLQQYLKEQDADLFLFQDVDIASTRSYKIDVYERLCEALPRYSHIASRYQHTGYIFYPLGKEQGLINSDLVTLSRHKTTYGLRKSLPIKETTFGKLSSVDQCFSITYMPVNRSNGRYLVLLNINLDKDAIYRQKQLQDIYEFANMEYQDGNYVIIGGNFNSDTAQTIATFTNQQQQPKWMSDFAQEGIPEGFHFVQPTNESTVATFHQRDIPYEQGISYESHTSGFIVSNNMTASAEILDTAYHYSNHNPVKLSFKLLIPKE